MLSSLRVKSFRLGLATCAMLLVSCGFSNFHRADAISTLQAAGATTAEATCMADALIERDQLGSADPRSVTSEQDRTNLQLVKQECVTIEVLPAFEVTVEEPADAREALAVDDLSSDFTGPPELEAEEIASLDEVLAADPETLRQDAIARLVALGRDEPNATCVVDHLVAFDALSVLASEDLGLGLDVEEASAIAACA